MTDVCKYPKQENEHQVINESRIAALKRLKAYLEQLPRSGIKQNLDIWSDEVWKVIYHDLIEYNKENQITQEKLRQWIKDEIQSTKSESNNGSMEEELRQWIKDEIRKLN